MTCQLPVSLVSARVRATGPKGVEAYCALAIRSALSHSAVVAERHFDRGATYD